MSDLEIPDPPVEPEPEPEPDPAADAERPGPHDNPLADGVAQMDAPEEMREEFFAPTLGTRVALPGRAEVAGAGARRAVHGQHNWVPIGPRNVGGRVRAIAIDPANPQVMYAAPASGGVFKSLDAAESWFPLWHDEPSLSMGALAICRDHPRVLWAGTGETRTGGGETIPGAGVLRSDNGGESWTPPNPGEDILRRRVHALAAHPTEALRCWAATSEGLYRTMDGGRTWIRFLANRSVTDVLFATVGGSLRLFAVLSGSGADPGPPPRRRLLVLRIDRPDDTDVPGASTSALLTGLLPPGPAATPDQLLPLTGTFTLPTDSGEPGDGKLALYPGGAAGFADPVLYVLYANRRRNFFAIFRCGNLNAATPAGLRWARLATLPVFHGEGQGTYNLTIAVSPQNPNQLAFGMVELYLNENAAAASSLQGHWKRAQMWDLNFVERGHHADHHALVFAPAPAAPFNQGLAPPGAAAPGAGTIVLWDANDGGISLCANWAGSTTYQIHVDGHNNVRARAALPIPAGAPLWRKRSHGISATQMYDLTQHPRLPPVVGCGFQDNGAYLATGGPSWQLLIGADGGFVAFDPDDPYRVIVSWQAGVAESRFPGRLREALPLLEEGVNAGLWPRILSDGFLGSDGPPFVAETVFHPTQPGRVLTARENRVYGTRTTTGDRWIPEPLGHGIELVHSPTAAGATRSFIEIGDTVGARALGLVPQLAVTESSEDARMLSRVRSLAGQPFAIANGQQLDLTFGSDVGAAVGPLHIPLTVGPGLPASATAGQLAAYLRREIRARISALAPANPPDVDVLGMVWPLDTVVFVVSNAVGRAQTIRVGSSAPAKFGVVARDYLGADAGAPVLGGAALPAMVPVALRISAGRRLSEGADLTGETLHFERQGGAAAVDITCDTDFADPSHVYLADFVELLRRRLPAAQYAVWTCPVFWGLRLTTVRAAAGKNLTLSGDLVPDLELTPDATGQTVRISRRLTVDLTPVPPDRHLRVRADGKQTAETALDLAFVGVSDLTAVTLVELCHAIRTMIGAAVDVRVDLDLHLPGGGEPTEFAFGPVGSRRVWVGDSAGRLYRSGDDGASWAEVVSSPFAERYRPVEAIAVRPHQPEHVVVGAYLEGAHQPPVDLLFRSDDDGGRWRPVANPILDAAGNRVGVRALVFDPSMPGHLYAATDIGVYHSADAGDNWVPFTEGMPNARVTDLAYEPTTRMLRAGAWGRGVYERHLGTRAPKDVRLYIRSTALDDGSAQPYPGPDLLATVSAPLRLDASPDIKQLRSDPRRGLLLDGVEFDEEISSTDVRAGSAFVAVQVHNRGAFATSTARVAVLWAPAANGPPPLPAAIQTALAGGAIAAGTIFGAWKVIADDTFADPHNAGHNLVAPGYPRIAVIGASPPFSWPAADLAGHARIGLLALTHCDEDPLRIGTTDVLELVRSEAKAAYRECRVVADGADALTVIRVTRGRGFGVEAPTDGSANGAKGAAPFGLAAAAGPVLEARLTRPEPFNLSAAAGVGFRLTFTYDPIVIPFAADDPSFRVISRADENEVAAVINRALVAADIPVRASRRIGTEARVRLTGLRGARFTAAGTAALLGLNAGAPTKTTETSHAQRGPWNLTPPGGVPRELRLQVTNTVDIRLGPHTPEFANPAAATAAEVRAAINRQILQGGLTTVVAEPLIVALSVRRSTTEAAGSRTVTGGYAAADLVGSPDAILAEHRLERFRVISAHDADRLTSGQRNFLYVRVANVGSVRADPARVRLFELTVPAAPGPVTRSEPAFGSVDQPLAPGGSAIVEVPFDLDARPSGSRVFILAVADLAASALEPPASLPSLEDWHRFSLEHHAAAIRELVVA